jgi:hypothetical protein
MAVGTHGNQVPAAVYFVTAPDRRQRYDVVDVDEALTNLPIRPAELEPTHRTYRAVVGDTVLAGSAVTLVPIDEYADGCPLKV